MDIHCNAGVICQDMGLCGIIEMVSTTSCSWQECRNTGTA